MNSRSHISQGSSEPLLPPKLANDQEPPFTPTAAFTTKTISVLRIALGASCLIAPRWTCGLFFFPVPATVTLLPRLFGIRELVIGELLLTAEDKNSPDMGRREIKRALWANIAGDAVDIGSVAFGLATGTIGKLPAATLAGGALIGLGLCGVSLKGFRDGDGTKR